MPDSIRPFAISIPQADIDDLHRRLASCRWPDEEPVPDQSQGAKLADVQKLVAHWRDGYDWRRCEAELNAYPQFLTEIDEVDIHFLHVRSPHAGALPLILTHGWPGSVIEFMKAIGPLTEPEKHGGNAEDAFHLVIPSVPGFGFSGKPRNGSWTVERIAAAWEVLMARLGYDRWVAQGGDVGSAVSSMLGQRAAPGLLAVHTNMPFVLPPPPYDDLLPDQQQMMGDLTKFGAGDGAYAALQGTRPQTLGYGLADSPVGQAAWIYEKLAAWSDSDGVAENVFTRDEMLDNIMLYWLTNSATSSARFYWDNHGSAITAIPIKVPVGCTIFPGELYRAARSWAEACMDNIIYWNVAERGGHFAAFEQPEIFTRELRACFGLIR